MSKLCEYYFALHSPFAYLGHVCFMELVKQYNVKIVLCCDRNLRQYRPCTISAKA